MCSLSNPCSFYPSNAVALASITTPATNRTCCDSEKERMMRLVRGLDLEVADYAWELQGNAGSSLVAQGFLKHCCRAIPRSDNSNPWVPAQTPGTSRPAQGSSEQKPELPNCLVHLHPLDALVCSTLGGHPFNQPHITYSGRFWGLIPNSSGQGYSSIMLFQGGGVSLPSQKHLECPHTYS